MGLSPAMVDTCVKAIMMRCENLPAVLPLAIENLPTELDSVEVVSMELPDYVQVKGFPSFAYDKHTMGGKKAIRIFHERVGEELDLDFSNDLTAMAVFTVEGGRVLDRHLQTSFTKMVYSRAMLLEARGFGLTVHEMFSYHGVVRERLEDLNKIRQQHL